MASTSQETRKSSNLSPSTPSSSPSTMAITSEEEPHPLPLQASEEEACNTSPLTTQPPSHDTNPPSLTPSLQSESLHPGTDLSTTCPTPDHCACCHNECVSREEFLATTHSLKSEISALRSALQEARQTFKIEIDSLTTQLTHHSVPVSSPAKDKFPTPHGSTYPHKKIKNKSTSHSSKSSQPQPLPNPLPDLSPVENTARKANISSNSLNARTTPNPLPSLSHQNTQGLAHTFRPSRKALLPTPPFPAQTQNRNRSRAISPLLPPPLTSSEYPPLSSRQSSQYQPPTTSPTHPLHPRHSRYTPPIKKSTTFNHRPDTSRVQPRGSLMSSSNHQPSETRRNDSPQQVPRHANPLPYAVKDENCAFWPFQNVYTPPLTFPPTNYQFNHFPRNPTPHMWYNWPFLMSPPIYPPSPMQL